nr:hypothetical protein Iba_chr13bCG0130 [Ipomoea batatas]GMD80403.1 hypothetical protein Iba_chr13eCG1530 [Ipomoea batatas]
MVLNYAVAARYPQSIKKLQKWGLNQLKLSSSSVRVKCCFQIRNNREVCFLGRIWFVLTPLARLR